MLVIECPSLRSIFIKYVLHYVMHNDIQSSIQTLIKEYFYSWLRNPCNSDLMKIFIKI